MNIKNDKKKFIQSILKLNKNLDDPSVRFANSKKRIVITDSSFHSLNGKKSDFVYKLNEVDNNFSNDIDKNDEIFIHSLYSRKVSSILNNIGLENIIDITHYNWRNAKILNRDLLIENIDKISLAYDLLSDQCSRKTFEMLIHFRMTANPSLIFTSNYDQYFHPDVRPSINDVFLDGGAFTGDTVLDFYRKTSGMIRAACFEPDRSNYNMLLDTVRINKLEDNVSTHRCGLWSSQKYLGFDSASQSSRIVDNSSQSIQVMDIDTYCSKMNFQPTLIKMDVEGAEIEALKGADNTVKTMKPKMMISAYHHGSHLWEVPLKLAELGYTNIFLGHHPPEYTIYETVAYAY